MTKRSPTDKHACAVFENQGQAKQATMALREMIFPC